MPSAFVSEGIFLLQINENLMIMMMMIMMMMMMMISSIRTPYNIIEFNLVVSLVKLVKFGSLNIRFWNFHIPEGSGGAFRKCGLHSVQLGYLWYNLHAGYVNTVTAMIR